MSAAMGSYDGEKAAVATRTTLTTGVIVRSKAMAFSRQSRDGMSQREIARYWGVTQPWVSMCINALTRDQRAAVDRMRRRAAEADRVLAELEAEDE
jgi:predicted transcriptional regulator